MAHRILVAGCGYTGTALAVRLAAEGHRVWGLRRTAGAVAPGVETLSADLLDAGLGARVPEEIDRVFYTAAADDGSEEAYRAAYVEALDRLLGVLEARGGPRPRVLFTSSTSVHHQRDGSAVDEDSPTQPEGHRGRIMLEAEARLARSPLETVALRLGGIYGPGRTRFIEAVRSGRARRTRGAPRYTNRIHRDDAAGALAHLAALPAPRPLYLGVDDDPAERDEVLSWLAARLGMPPPPDEEPGPGPHDAGKRCSNARLRASGYVFRYPDFRAGYGALIDASDASGPGS